MAYLDFLQLSSADKKELFKQVAVSKGVPDFAIEKDWWVVRLLDVIFQTEISSYAVFKGGTSLSKGWGIIDRFSEDVDIAMDRSFFGFDKLSPSKKELTKLRKVSKEFLLDAFVPNIEAGLISAHLHGIEIKVEKTTESDRDPIIIEFYYPSETNYSAYILPRVLIEIGIRSMKEPFTNRPIQSMLAEEFFGLPFADKPIAIPTVNVERTFLEKLFLLHEEFQRPTEKVRVQRLSRHLYDIHRINQTEFAERALNNKELYHSIVRHRLTFSKLGGVDYSTHFPPNLNPIPPNEILDKWQSDYNIMQEQMIYGDSPSFGKLIDDVRKLVLKINHLGF